MSNTLSLENTLSLCQKQSEEQLREMVIWWDRYSQDYTFGGFYGEVGNDCIPDTSADKGLVLNGRILWFFSMAASRKDLPSSVEKTSEALAHRAYHYFELHFDDVDHGGAFWCLDMEGRIKDDKKQVYAQAFAIFALSSYYLLSKRESVLTKALRYFECIEHHACDREYGGYFEAFSRDWSTRIDEPMTAFELPVPKTMNTHLHLVEAYTLLLKVSGDERVKEALHRLLECVLDNIFDAEHERFKLFFDRDWQDRSSSSSFGHDIELGWLIWEGVKAVGHSRLMARAKSGVLALLSRAFEVGRGPKGQALDGFNLETQTFDEYYEWWVQAEALIGALVAYEISDDKKYLQDFVVIWQFIQEQLIDTQHGEWFCCTRDQQAQGMQRYKIGFWKGPYHNGRALMDVSTRLRLILDAA